MLPNLLNLATALRRPLGIALLFCLGFAGCASLDAPSELDDPDPDAKIGAQLRKPGPPGQMLGIDQRAREIERNLGVR